MFKGIGIIPNWQKKHTRQVVSRIEAFFKAHEIPVYIEPANAPLLHLPSPIAALKKWPELVDIAIVVGGDGTFLRVSRELASTELPILGINMGHKGFLAEIEIPQLDRYLEKLMKKEYVLGERMMLFTQVIRNEELYKTFISLNDVIISRGPFSRIIKLDTYVNEDFLESYPGDGVIIASPTGSTGYSLSAGGPVLNPALKALVITPICPHLLYQRSVVVNMEDKVSITVATEHGEVFLTFDGQEGFALLYQDRIQVAKADCLTRVVNFPGHNFYKLLHDKLMDA